MLGRILRSFRRAEFKIHVTWGSDAAEPEEWKDRALAREAPDTQDAMRAALDASEAGEIWMPSQSSASALTEPRESHAKRHARRRSEEIIELANLHRDAESDGMTRLLYQCRCGECGIRHDARGASAVLTFASEHFGHTGTWVNGLTRRAVQ